MKKRILSLALSLALCASLATPALAAETVVLTAIGPGEYANQLTLTGVLAQEEVTLEFRNYYGQGYDIEDVSEQCTIYTVARDFTTTAIYDTRRETVEDGIELPFYSGYRLSEDGKYVRVGFREAGEIDCYGIYAPEGKRVPVTQEEFDAMGNIWDSATPVTRDEFFSACDLISMGSDNFNIDVWIRVENGAAAPTTPAVPTVAPSPCKGTLDGMMLTLNAYLFQENGGGSNYVMLRDVAQLLNGTKAQFEVTWDKDKGIVLTTGQAYTTVGGELKSKGEGDKPYTANTSTITIDGKAVELTAYTIEGNNYFKLRDLGEALGFNVGWDGATGTVTIDSTQPYSGTN